MPRLRQRVKPALGLQPPVWVDDHDFDLSYHLRRLALAPPGDERQLYDLATLLTADPFDRTRPLWQMVIIEGVTGGRAALLMRFHHTLMDGEGGVRLSLQFLDFERDAPEKPLPPEVEAVAAPPTASPTEVARDVMTSTLRVPMGLAREWGDLLADPRRIPEVSAAAATSLRAIVRQLSDTKRALSPLWTQRSLSRRLETLQVPFDDVKTAAKDLGGSINTAFITAATEAAGRYHVAQGAPIEELRASMAISTRTRATTEANAFTLARMLVPAGEMSIEERFKRIQEATDTARSESGQASLNVLAGVTAALTHLAARADRPPADRDRRLRNLKRSGLTGPPVPRRVEGGGELPDRTHRRHRVQPHPALIRGKPRHGAEHRRGGRRVSGDAAKSDGRVLRGPGEAGTSATGDHRDDREAEEARRRAEVRESEAGEEELTD